MRARVRVRPRAVLSTAHLKVDAGAEAVFAAELVVQLDLLLPVGLLATRRHDLVELLHHHVDHDLGVSLIHLG